MSRRALARRVVGAAAGCVAVLYSVAAPAAQGVPAPRAPDPTFEQWCSHCHRSGLYMAGTAGLQAKYQGAVPAVLEERTDLTPIVVRNFVRRGSNSMAPFRKTEISDAELDALARYLARQ